jgi:26S proteasome regulatory subunit T1
VSEKISKFLSSHSIFQFLNKDLDEGDIELLKTYGQGQYHKAIKQIEDDIQKAIKQVNELTGIKESDTGLAPPALWDLA